MNRDCCICDTKVIEFTNQSWQIPSISEQKIGFGICNTCGMIIQSTTPTIKEVINYYENAATYSNPGREGKPSTNKTNAVNRQLDCIYKDIKDPKKVFQVGCSDGYTLSEFLARGVLQVSGIDPGSESSKVAKSLYGIDTIVGTLEDTIIGVDNTNCDLVVLTHVLEHLFDPIEALKKCRTLLNNTGWLLIEVPLFENVSKMPNGIFTLEHLNYFTEGTIVQAVTDAGYDVIRIEKDFDSDEYPVITINCRIKDQVTQIKSNDFQLNKKALEEYLLIERTQWKECFTKISMNIQKGATVYIYGAGIHTSQLIANTEIESYLDIAGILDSSSTKWGIDFGKYKCVDPSNADYKKIETIVISSKSSENEIYKALMSNNLTSSLKIIKLYEN
jgi:SAM-dependent methyltransferase